MERKRVAGRFVRQGLDSDGGAKSELKRAAAGAPRAKNCRTFTRARVAEALPEIVERFAEEAKRGSIAHAKVLLKMGGLDTGDVLQKNPRRRGKSLVALLLENLKQDSVPPQKDDTPNADLPNAEPDRRISHSSDQ